MKLEDRPTPRTRAIIKRDYADEDTAFSELAHHAERLERELGAAVEALEEIANSPHSVYPGSPTQYKIGVVDGHRCAAGSARAVLAEIAKGRNDG
jgi:hypothetical protein